MAESWVVNQPVVDMHAQPSAEAPVVSQAIYGTNVEVVGRQGEWVQIQTPDLYRGWVPQAALFQRDRPYATGERVARVWSLFANLYREADVTRRAPVLCLPFGVRLELDGGAPQDDRWLRVLLVDGNQAWVQQGDVNSRLEPLSADEVIAIGKRLVGLPYRWGGTSTFGFDCSGLTQLLCSLRGVVIPRDSGPQSRWEGMVDVERAQLQPGDLLFFGASPEKVTHTGMYIGQGQFLHATTHGRPVVQISDLSDPHWSRLLVRCRRLRESK